MTISAAIRPAPGQPSIWGKTPAERTQRQLTRMPDVESAARLWLRGDVIYDDAVLRGLGVRPNSLLVGEGGERLGACGDAAQQAAIEDWRDRNGAAPAGFTEITPAEAGLAYNRKLRKRATPQCHSVTPGNAAMIERRLYDASYKGVTDLVTKYLWPVPAYHATRLCARLGLSPNMVTSTGAVFMTIAFLLFWAGDYGAGLGAAWVMTFLDTVDGKLARCTLTSSKWGDIFDHGIDIVHPPFWYIAWGIGLGRAGLDAHHWLVPGLAALFAAYIVNRLCETYFIRTFGFHLHVWRRGDSFFRLIVARRNINLLILSVSWLAGRPDIGLFLVIAWTLAAIPVHLMQILQARAARRRGLALTSWLSA